MPCCKRCTGGDDVEQQAYDNAAATKDDEPASQDGAKNRAFEAE